jgi:hypothetical protein
MSQAIGGLVLRRCHRLRLVALRRRLRSGASLGRHVPSQMTQTELRITDDWRRRQPDLPARAEAGRRLIQLGLTAKTAPPNKRA